LSMSAERVHFFPRSDVAALLTEGVQALDSGRLKVTY
jgi:hypothetical protein